MRRRLIEGSADYTETWGAELFNYILANRGELADETWKWDPLLEIYRVLHAGWRNLVIIFTGQESTAAPTIVLAPSQRIGHV